MELYELESIPSNEQVLVYAGKLLKDHLSLADHSLNDFTLSDEVVLYLSRKRAHPKTIFLASRATPSLKLTEQVESESSVGSVMDLLVLRGVASPFTQGATVIAKRTDGTTIPLDIDPGQPLSVLETKLRQIESVGEVAGLTFYQAQDGCMIISVWPSSSSEASTYPVYERSNAPQPQMRKKKVSTGTMNLADLSKQLCV